jgi:hypothetical protein
MEKENIPYTPSGLVMLSKEAIDEFFNEPKKISKHGLESNAEFYFDIVKRVLKDDEGFKLFCKVSANNLEKDDAIKIIDSAAFTKEMFIRNYKKYNLKLPQLKKEVIEVFLRDIRKRREEGKESYRKFSKEMINRINLEDPNFKLYLENLLQYYSINSLENISLPSIGAGFTYEIYRRQAETNNLEKTIGRTNIN